MGDVNSNAIDVLVSRESAMGVAGATWQRVEPNDIPAFAAQVRTLSRRPMNKTRRRRKGDAVGVDSAPALEADLIWEHLYEFVEAFMFSSFSNPGGTGQAHFVPTGVTATGYTVAANGNLTDGTLIVARGMNVVGNNGLKKTVGAIALEIKAAGLAIEALTVPDQNATVDVAGFEFADADATIDANGDLTCVVANLSNKGLNVGQYVWLGGDLATENFPNAANKGLARIKSIAAGKLGLERKSQAFVPQGSGAGKTVRIFWGQWARDVAADHASWLKRSYTVELTYPDLATPGPGSEFQYAIAGFADELTLNFELEALTTMTIGFVGTDTQVPVEAASRKAGAANPKRVVSDKAFNTTNDFIKLVLAETTETVISADFTALSMTIANNVSPRKLLGAFAARKMNIGDFDVNLDGTIVFNESRILSAIRNNDPVTMWFGQRSEDGAFLIDIPRLMLEGGDQDYPRNEQVLVSWNGYAAEDPTLGYCVSISLFPYLPAS